MYRKLVLGFWLVAAGLLAWTVAAQPPAGTQPSPRELKRQFAAAAEKGSAPTEQHKLLGALVGGFDQAVAVRIGPGEPLKFHSICKGEWIMGGRYVKVESTAAPDEESKGDRLTVYGYEPYTKKFTMWGIDSMSTSAVSAQGDHDSGTRTLVLEGEREQGALGKVPFRWVIRLQDDRTFTQEIQLKAPGAEDFVTTVVVKHSPRSE